MKIHGQFRDYYDIGLSVGVDPSLHYNRKQRLFYPGELKARFPENTIGSVRFSKHGRPRPDVERVLIGFCGTIYPCIRLIYSDRVENIYDPKHLDTFFKLKIPSWGIPSEHWERHHKKDQRNRAAWLKNRQRADALFLEVNAPLFVVDVEKDQRGQPARIFTNTSLREYDFAKVKDPFTAFQEISMYLGNELVKHDMPDTIPDEYRIAMHGYDKHSFRHPTRTRHLQS